MAADPLTEPRGVNKYFGDLHVLQDIEFTVGKGEAVVSTADGRIPEDRTSGDFFTRPSSDRAGDRPSKILKR
ncbi:hypothetical protein [Streptomyces fimbriatus]|uniref:Uncharacterized protein n=1 Tax=Streptomyces fimbriatus TaxID=68197 RepID=A0ABW0D7G4_STRFI